MEYIWITRQGKRINVDDMDINHLRNALKMLMRLKVAQRTKPVEIHGEIAQEHADAYKVYKATGVDILNDDDMDMWGI